MRKVSVTLPATLTCIGPALGSLGLALAMHTTVEVSASDGTDLLVEPAGEGSGHYPLGLQHPTVLGLIAAFQAAERAVTGLRVRVENRIPFDAGLGAKAAHLTAGIIAGNNLLGNPLSRDQVLALATQRTHQPDHTVATVLGGLNAAMMLEDQVIWRSFDVAPMRVVVALPETTSPPLPSPELVAHEDALANLSRVPLVLEALRTADHPLLAQVMTDSIIHPQQAAVSRLRETVAHAARAHGASAITTSGGGPALVIFAPDQHRKIAIAVEDVFRQQRVNGRTWILPIDTQGVIVSAMQSG